MKPTSKFILTRFVTVALASAATIVCADEPLPSWNDGPAKKAIIEFVGKVTRAGSPDFVPVAERIATFDNDGTLWAEQPLYFQFIFMLELLAYLRANGFKTFIVSGGGIEFMRPWTEKVYGIPPEQVVGSSIRTKFEMRDGKPVLRRLPEMNFVDDKIGKPIGIHTYIGRRPIAAFGNSDGDREMLEWTQAGGGARLMMLVHHDDAKREWAYGAESKIGTFSNALMAEAKENGWTVISMKNEWKRIFPFESLSQPFND